MKCACGIIGEECTQSLLCDCEIIRAGFTQDVETDGAGRDTLDAGRLALPDELSFLGSSSMFSYGPFERQEHRRAILFVQDIDVLTVPI
jgi:hypothetical protein